MARPRKATRDEWLDQFADWDVETQERMIDVLGLLHRQSRRRTAKKDGEGEQAPLLAGTEGE